MLSHRNLRFEGRQVAGICQCLTGKELPPPAISRRLGFFSKPAVAPVQLPESRRGTFGTHFLEL
jgi:hypothetical protein